MIEPFTSKLCQQQSNWLSHKVNCMNSENSPMQFEHLPFNTNPYGVSTYVGSHNYEFCGFHEGNLLIEPQWHFAQQSIAQLQSPTPTPNFYLKGQQLLSSARVDWKQPPLESNPPLQRKKFLIFDRSGDGTRVIFSSLGSSSVRNQRDLETCKAVLGEKYPGVRSVQPCPEFPSLCEESDENQIVGAERSDYHEDTDEINALLYSEDDDDTGDGEDNDVDCDTVDEDEVSTGHSPLIMNLDFNDLKRGSDDIKDEVSSPNLSSKRQKLFDSACGTFSAINTRREGMPPPTKWHKGETLVDLNTSSYGGGERGPDFFDNTRSRKDKIRETLKVLEKLIPGPTTSKDPLVIIDQAIDYLKHLKVMVKCRSLEDPDCSGPLN